MISRVLKRSPRRVPAAIASLLLLAGSALHQEEPRGSGDGADAILRSRVVTRSRNRVYYAGRTEGAPPLGQISLEYTTVYWGELSDDHWMKAEREGRWSPGDEFWAVMDSDLTLEFGKRRVPPGHYYIVLERSKGKPALLLSDSARVREARLSHGRAADVDRAYEIPLQSKRVQGQPRDLLVSIGFVDRSNAPEKLEFRLQLGPIEYTASIVAKGREKTEASFQTEKRYRALLIEEARGPDAAIVTVEHAPAEWNPARAEGIAALKPGQRLHLGDGFWSSLESSVAVTLGETKLDAGHHYLMLARSENDGWRLVLWPSVESHKKTVDASRASDTRDGVSIPLSTERVEPASREPLSVTLAAGQGGEAAMNIRWGPYRWLAPMRVHGGEP